MGAQTLRSNSRHSLEESSPRQWRSNACSFAATNWMALLATCSGKCPSMRGVGSIVTLGASRVTSTQRLSPNETKILGGLPPPGSHPHEIQMTARHTPVLSPRRFESASGYIFDRTEGLAGVLANDARHTPIRSPRGFESASGCNSSRTTGLLVVLAICRAFRRSMLNEPEPVVRQARNC